MKTLFTSFTLVALTFFAAAQVEAQSGVPAPPTTGPRSIQMFQGGTQSVWACVYPPTTYSDGTPIKNGTPVKIKVYRSYDGGKTFSSRVTVLSGGSGFVGQGQAGSRKKPWIDAKLQVPVDNKAPYTVVLGMTVVVGKNESALTVSNLTFRYYPSLQVYGSPSDAPGNDSKKGTKPGKGHGPLHGTWTLNKDTAVFIRENGNKVTGTMTRDLQQASITGTRSGNRYNLTLTIGQDGKLYKVALNLTVASNGKSISGTASMEGESFPLTFKINGRNLTIS